MLEPAPETEELRLTALYPGIEVEEAQAATGWPLKIAPNVAELPEPTQEDLAVLRALHARTQAAHAQPVRIALPA
jgi:glutaconate CoA-transferase subunit B